LDFLRYLVADPPTCPLILELDLSLVVAVVLVEILMVWCARRKWKVNNSTDDEERPAAARDTCPWHSWQRTAELQPHMTFSTSSMIVGFSHTITLLLSEWRSHWCPDPYKRAQGLDSDQESHCLLFSVLYRVFLAAFLAHWLIFLSARPSSSHQRCIAATKKPRSAFCCVLDGTLTMSYTIKQCKQESNEFDRCIMQSRRRFRATSSYCFDEQKPRCWRFFLCFFSGFSLLLQSTNGFFLVTTSDAGARRISSSSLGFVYSFSRSSGPFSRNDNANHCLPFMGRRPLSGMNDVIDLQSPHVLLDSNNNSSSSSNETTSLYPIGFMNFWQKTQANYTICEKPDRPADFTSRGRCRASKYWDYGHYVVRYSDHWSGQHGVGHVRDCFWTIDVLQQSNRHYIAGMCYYKDFNNTLLSRRKASSSLSGENVMERPKRLKWKYRKKEWLDRLARQRKWIIGISTIQVGWTWRDDITILATQE
jgi:hypothetical protein